MSRESGHAFQFMYIYSALEVFQKAVEVKDGDTPEILQKRVMEQAEWKLLPAAINKIANEHDN